MTNRSLSDTAPDTASVGTHRDAQVVLQRMFRRRKLIVGMFSLVLAATAVFTFTAPSLYTATATVRVGDPAQDGLFAQQSRYTDPRREVETQTVVVSSPQLESLVIAVIGRDVFEQVVDVDVSGSRIADLIDIEITAPDPQIAARVATVWAQQYVEFRQEQTAGSLNTMEAELRRRASEAAATIGDIDTELLQGPGDRAAVLRAQRDALQEQYLQFTQRADELAVDSQVRRGGVSIVAEPEVPTAPSSPNVVRNMALGLFVATMMAAGSAYARERFDDRVRGEDDLQLIRQRPALLGAVPEVKQWRRRGGGGLLRFDDPDAESFRQLRISLEFADFERQHKRIAFVSPLPGEGKSALVANLAVALAQSGRKVVLVDLDLRKDRQRQLFGLGKLPGFTDVIAGSVGLRDAVCRIKLASTGNGWLQVIPAGPCPPNPAELLSSNSTARFFEAVSAHADIVLVDTPAMLVVADAAASLPHVDTAVVVTSVKSSHRASLQRCLDVVTASNTPVLGAVLNAISRRDVHLGNYYYGYGYSADDSESTSQSSWWSRARRRNR